MVVSRYIELIDKLKQVIVKAGKKPYEMLIGKLNEPKLKNLAVVDMYVLVGCRETSIIDSKEFYASVLTPHEVFMALMPEVFGWESKIITDFNILVQMLHDHQSRQDKQGEEETKDGDS